MFERFTEKARRATIYAQEESNKRSWESITPAALLLGLIREENGIAAKALRETGVNLYDLRTKIEASFPNGSNEHEPYTHIPFHKDTKNALELTLKNALQISDKYIGTEHLLLGLLDQGNLILKETLGKHLRKYESEKEELIEAISLAREINMLAEERRKNIKELKFS